MKAIKLIQYATPIEVFLVIVYSMVLTMLGGEQTTYWLQLFPLIAALLGTQATFAFGGNQLKKYIETLKAGGNENKTGAGGYMYTVPNDSSVPGPK